MTECILLVEYTEVMIPMVYCLYLLVVDHLSNRVYYAQLKNLNDALLELVSILLLSWLLDRRCSGVPSIHLLAFVLENQWQIVQVKLVLWVVVAVQLSLKHFGADYSFQFKWFRSH